MSKTKTKKIKKSNARKTSTVPTRVYTYGALPLSPEQQQLVNDQLFAAHRYRNTLVEIERKRREDYRGIRGKLSRPLVALEAAYDVAQAVYSEARKRLSQVPKAERALSPIAVEVRALAKARNKSWLRVRGERGVVERKHFRKADTAFRRLKKVRRAAVLRKTGAAGPLTMAAITRAVRAKMQTGARWPLAWRKKDKSQRVSEEAHRAARAASGCFSGVYAAVDTAAERSFKDTAFNPRFASYDHTGKIGAQITGKVTVADALSGRNTLIKIDMCPDVHVRGEKRAARLGQVRQAAVARVRLSSAHLEAAYLDIPFVMHRPLPADGVLKWVYLVVKRVGLRSVYELQFTVESEEFVLDRTSQKGVLAINLGWRVMDKGDARVATPWGVLGEGDIRVATTWDGRKEGAVYLPAKLRASADYSDRLLGYADHHFNDARAALKQWLDTSEPDLDAAFYDKYKLSSIGQWRARGKLARVAFALRDRYLKPGLAESLWAKWLTVCIPDKITAASPKRDLFTMAASGPVPEEPGATYKILTTWFKSQGVRSVAQRMALYLEWWRRKDAHLTNTARGTDQRLLRYRREIYRVAARRWADVYKTVVIEKWDKRKTAETPEPENDTRTPQEEIANGVRQLCGVSVLVGAVKQTFGTLDTVPVPPAKISTTHYGCGGEGVATLVHRMVRCAKCARGYDQDVNAARNLWERERSGDAGSTGTARGAGKARKIDDVAAE